MKLYFCISISIISFLLCLLGGCTHPQEADPPVASSFNSDSAPAISQIPSDLITVSPSSPSQNTDSAAPEKVHSWAGNGYMYYSDALEISIEFPMEWEDLINVYDNENTIRIDAVVGWDDSDPDNGRLATVYKFSHEDWNNESGAYKKGMFEGGPAIQVIAEDENFIYIMKRYGGLIGFKTLNDPGFEEYKDLDEALKNYEFEIHFP